MRVLIADDADSIRRVIRQILSRDSELDICDDATDCSDTLSKARQLKPDVILLDFMMLGTNAVETVGLLRKQVPGVKLIIISGHSEDLVSALPHHIDVDAALAKTTLSSALLATIYKVTSRSGPQ